MGMETTILRMFSVYNLRLEGIYGLGEFAYLVFRV